MGFVPVLFRFSFWVKYKKRCGEILVSVIRTRSQEHAVSPLEVHRGDVEDHSFEPQDHEEPLGEGAVADALAVTARLVTTTIKSR